MPRSRTLWSALRLAWRSLRVRLALIYAALFCVSVVAVGAVAVIFKPNFLVHSASAADPHPPRHSPPCCRNAPASFLGTLTHDASQNLPGVVLAVVIGVLAVAGGWLLAGRVLRPLRAINSSARAISASNLHQRLDLGAPHDEFTELGATLDDLFGRLEASFDAQRRFVANASHELRTPLAAGRTLLQVALADPAADPGTLRSACREALDLGDRQERLIDGLLTLATSERGIEEWRPLDLCELAARVVTRWQPEAGRRGIDIGADLKAAPAAGDPSLAESLIANLVDNALRYNQPASGTEHGAIEITTAVADGRATLRVSNSGRSIPADEVDGLFQPFRRLGADRTDQSGGHGLGLAIVRAIAAAHHATLTATARAGGGLDIELSFPEPPGRP
jgi:signal transduction histidine kinase